MYSRVWLTSFFGIGLFALYGLRLVPVRHRAPLDARRPARPPRGHGRRRRARRALDHARWSASATRDVRIVGVFDDRGDDRSPDHLRRPAEARHGRRPRRIRAPHPRRSRDLLAADLGRDPHPADAQEALGAAGRHPPLGAHQQAAVPPALLFLHRQRAGARRVRPADRRLGRRDEMAVRQDRRRPRLARRRSR